MSVIFQPLDEIIESSAAVNKKALSLPFSLWPDKEDIAFFFDWLKKDKRQIKNSAASLEAMRNYYFNPPSALHFRCFAGQRNLVIHPDGNVSLCFKGKIVGNAAIHGLAEILASQAARSERLAIKRCQKYCRVLGCNFSRGIKECLREF